MCVLRPRVPCWWPPHRYNSFNQTLIELVLLSLECHWTSSSQVLDAINLLQLNLNPPLSLLSGIAILEHVYNLPVSKVNGIVLSIPFLIEQFGCEMFLTGVNEMYFCRTCLCRFNCTRNGGRSGKQCSCLHSSSVYFWMTYLRIQEKSFTFQWREIDCFFVFYV